MDFLISLLAFATVMILMSTLVMMVVNGVNGIARLRSRTLERSMRLLYEDIIAPRIGEKPSKSSSKKFARELLSNPSLRRPGSVLEDTWLGPKDFDRLSSRTFVEQLARTKVGRELARQHQLELTDQLEGILYQFERYSDAGNTYFLRRSRLISIIVAIFLAFALNIDAVRLFSGFLQNRELASSFAVLGENLKNDENRPKEITDRYATVVVEQLASAQLSGLAIGPTQYPFCQTLYEYDDESALASVNEDILNLGRDPRCRDEVQRTIAHTGLVAPIFSRGRTDIIGRIIGDRNTLIGSQSPSKPDSEDVTDTTNEIVEVSSEPASAASDQPTETMTLEGSEETEIDPAVNETDDSLVGEIEESATPVVETTAEPNEAVIAQAIQDGAKTNNVFDNELVVMLLWIISIFISGGLIGLGAPFWAKTYGQVASLIPALRVIAPLVNDRSVRLGGSRQDQQTVTYRDRSRDRANRIDDETLKSKDTMRQAFDHSLPPEEVSVAPRVGQRIGDSSASSTSGRKENPSSPQSRPGAVDGTRSHSSSNQRLRRRLPTI